MDACLGSAYQNSEHGSECMGEDRRSRSKNQYADVIEILIKSCLHICPPQEILFEHIIQFSIVLYSFLHKTHVDVRISLPKTPQSPYAQQLKLATRSKRSFFYPFPVAIDFTFRVTSFHTVLCNPPFNAVTFVRYMIV